MTTVENNTFTGPNAGIDGGYVPLTTIESTSVDGDLNLIKDDLNYHLSILQAIYTKLDTIETSATGDQTITEIVILINASAELLDADNLESTVALLSNIISDIEAHRITTTQSAMHPEDSIKSTGQTYSYTPSNIVTSCQNILDEINNVRVQIHKILGQSTWIDTPNIDIASIKSKLDTIESGATTDQIASEVSNTPTGNIIATDVQAAIDELDTEKETPTAAQDKVDTHAVLTASHGVNGDILGSEDKDVANGVAGLDATAKLLWDQMPLPMLTVAQFQVNAGTGTAENPQKINDTSVTASVMSDVIGEYAQVLFSHPMWIKEYRHHGISGLAGDGRWKIQIYHDGAWIDNTVAIPLRNLESWSDWVALTIPVYTQGIRFVATTIDSTYGISSVRELEIRG